MGETILNAVLYGGIAVGLGALGGMIEIASRYQRAPFHALITLPALIYLVLNAAVSIVALVLIHAFGWIPVGINSSANPDLVRAVVAGLGGLILLRSTLTIHASEHNLTIGLSQFLEKALRASEIAIWRRETTDSMGSIAIIMEKVSFEKAYKVLPRCCIKLYGMNASPEEQKKLNEQLESIEKEMESYYLSLGPDKDAGAETVMLGMSLVNIVGESVLKEAIKVCSRTISKPDGE